MRMVMGILRALRTWPCALYLQDEDIPIASIDASIVDASTGGGGLVR